MSHPPLNRWDTVGPTRRSRLDSDQVNAGVANRFPARDGTAPDRRPHVRAACAPGHDTCSDLRRCDDLLPRDQAADLRVRRIFDPGVFPRLSGAPVL